MKPKKRGRKSATQVSQTVPKVEIQDDDVFEDVHRQPKLRPRLNVVKKQPPSSQTKTTCQRKTTTRTTRSQVDSNGKSDNTNKHVDKNCNMSSKNSMENIAETVSLIESEESDDFDLDLAPKRKITSDSDQEDIIQPKRKKSSVFVDLSHDENETTATEASDTNEQPHADSSSSQNDDNASNKSNDECISMGATTSDELEIATEIDLEPTIEMTEQNEPKEPSESANEPDPSESEANEAEPNEPETNEPKEAETEPTETTNVPGYSSDNQNGSDPENGEDDDFITLDTEIDLFDGVGEDETTPSTSSRQKETNKISLPRWKQAKTIVMESPLAQRQVITSVNRTITMNDNGSVKAKAPPTQPPSLRASVPAPAKEPAIMPTTTTAASSEPTRKSKMVFKIPQRPSVNTATNSSGASATSVGNRDPRMAKNAAPSNATPSTSTTATATTTTVQNKPEQVAPLAANNAGGQRVSVKDRLGNRFAAQPTGTSFIIPPSSSAPNNVAENTGASTQSQQPKVSGIFTNTYRRNQAQTQTQSQKNVQQPHPGLPLFVREALQNKLPEEFTIPSFAMGIQKYEPLFFRLFERTCRVFICDDCNSNDCQFEHQLPDYDTFRKTLDRIGKQRVIEFYDEFICRNQKLFDFYLIEFSKYFGKHSMVDKLKQMVDDCIERKVQFHFIKIVDGIMLTGASFSKALSEVIQSVNCRTMRTSKEIIKLVLHARNDTVSPFIKVIETIAKQESFKFSTEWVNKMLYINHEFKVKGLSKIIWDIINADLANLQKYDVDAVTKFLDNYGRSELP